MRFPIWGFSHPGTDRIEIHVGHGRDDRRFVQQRLALESTFPEAPGDAVFGVGLAGDRLVQTPHEPGNAEQPFAVFFDHGRNCAELRLGEFLVCNEAADQRLAAEQFEPARGNFLVVPGQRDILLYAQNQVRMLCEVRRYVK